MCVVKKLNHHNAVFALAERHGKLMDFSRCHILSAVHVACGMSVLAAGNIAVFIVCEV